MGDVPLAQRAVGEIALALGADAVAAREVPLSHIFAAVRPDPTVFVEPCDRGEDMPAWVEG